MRCLFSSGGHGCTLKTHTGLISGERRRRRWKFTIRSPFIPLSHDIRREAANDALAEEEEEGSRRAGGGGGRSHHQS